MMNLAVLFGVLLSVGALVWLAWHDPKRLRALGRRHAAAGAMQRRLAALIVLAPGLALTACAEWAELMIWTGAVLAAGWLLTQMLAIRDDEAASDA